MSKIDEVAESLVIHLQHHSMIGAPLKECTKLAKDLLIQNAFSGGLVDELAAMLANQVQMLAAEIAKRDTAMLPDKPMGKA